MQDQAEHPPQMVVELWGDELEPCRAPRQCVATTPYTPGRMPTSAEQCC
jgi:hypothetical protein